jgi:hypothetical protein
MRTTGPLIYVLMISTCISCANNRIDQEISKIDGLISRAEGLREKLGSDEIDSWHKIYYEVENHNRLIDSGLFADFANPELTTTIKAYREVYFTLGSCINSCVDLQKEISYTESHLRALRQGRIDGTLNDSAYQIQFRTEMELLDELTERIYTGLSTVEDQVERYRKYNPAIIKYMDQAEDGEPIKSIR